MATQRPIWKLMQEVPQEIFDKIYGLTFSTDSFPTTHNITSSTRPPAIMQVDRASRTTIQAAYYSASFILRDHFQCRRWIDTLSAYQKSLILGIQYSYHPDQDPIHVLPPYSSYFPFARLTLLTRTITIRSGRRPRSARIMATQRPIWKLMQEVPQEIFDKIYGLTFSTDSFPTTHNITSSTRPPAIMQVDRASRTTIQAAYYSASFILRDHFQCRRWIDTLSAYQKSLILGIQYSYHPDQDPIQNPLNEMLSRLYPLPMWQYIETWEFEIVTAKCVQERIWCDGWKWTLTWRFMNTLDPWTRRLRDCEMAEHLKQIHTSITHTYRLETWTRRLGDYDIAIESRFIHQSRTYRLETENLKEI
ncbi:uncharacterized protein MYCFIDRAFT_178808 [Pseudocercospora fijiensis CIRAD86]|uniref:Uncharacterized protein n=1 Tax=Pseudocercospora fijiensis (strain CIRAD86) TaxID=383855 RepID=M3A2S4_PSEFD|nr:uncharacterized protein MYCFIDRAFT_178808 [Pseudocercospora fijiensis CIRAD86]EME78696.1 hypothetical protein MYCFIDRAFT_178808 [Pseudocercospora fijiensis CIRAD86]